jgi:hypothetical protein
MGGLPGGYAPASIALRVVGACKSLQDKTVALEDGLLGDNYSPIISTTETEVQLQYLNALLPDINVY